MHESRFEQTTAPLNSSTAGRSLVPRQVSDPLREHGMVMGPATPVPQEVDSALSFPISADDPSPVLFENLEPVVALPAQRESERNLIPLQQWEGVVTQVGDDEFTATLRDLTTPKHPEEEAVLPIAEITPEDRRLLIPGAVLYWSIGYQTLRSSGQVQRVSDIRLRRLPAWSRRDLVRVAQRAQALHEMFGSDDDIERSTRAG